MSLGLSWPPSQSDLEPALLPLIPSAELDDHSSALNTVTNSNVNTLHSPPDHTDLLVEDPSEDFYLGLNAGDNSSTFNINLLTQDLLDTMERSPCSQYAPYPENLPSFDVNFRVTVSPEMNGMTQDLLTPPSSVFLVDEEEDVEDEDGLPSPLRDLLEDTAILDEIRLLDLDLEEGFSPGMVARLEEEHHLDCEIAQQETGGGNDHSGYSMPVTEDQGQPGRHQQGS